MYSMYQQLRAPWGRHGSSGWAGTRPEVGRRVRVRTPPAHTPPDTGYADHRTAEHSTAQQPGPSEASIHKATSRATTSAHSTTTSYQPANSARGALHDCMGGKRNSTSSNAPAKPEACSLECIQQRSVTVLPRRQVGDIGLRRHPVEPDRATQARNRQMEGVGEAPAIRTRCVPGLGQAQARTATAMNGSAVASSRS